MIKSALLDTSFLIALLNASRPSHATARQYFKYLVENGYLLYLSSVVLAEYCRYGAVEHLPLKQLVLLPFNFAHAVKSAELFTPDSTALPDDFKILAQAAVEGCEFILMEGAEPLFQQAQQLKAAGRANLTPVDLSSGFRVEIFNGGQTEMSFGV